MDTLAKPVRQADQGACRADPGDRHTLASSLHRALLDRKAVGAGVHSGNASIARFMPANRHWAPIPARCYGSSAATYRCRRDDAVAAELAVLADAPISLFPRACCFCRACIFV
ncbi:hypothetical protein R0381_002209 [Jeongeupia wiesaeckerbachi]|uniref:hypothetical protein n=1 Tax=Jeongeupia wiesaeckerbachi TaxID=3051218 RepID=UPI003D801DE2